MCVTYQQRSRPSGKVLNVQEETQQTRRDHLGDVVPDGVERTSPDVEEVSVVVVALVNAVPEAGKSVREEEDDPRLDLHRPDDVLQLGRQGCVLDHVNSCAIVSDDLARMNETHGEDGTRQHQDEEGDVSAVVDSACGRV